jgi:integrase
MPRPRLPHLVSEWTRHKKRVWFHRIGQGKRTRLRGDYGSEEFLAQYRAAEAGLIVPAIGRRAPAGSLEWLLAQYRAGSRWQELSLSTRRARDRLFVLLIKENGTADFQDINKAAIIGARDRRQATPHQANHLLKALRHMFDWAVEQQIVDDNPCLGVKLLKAAKTANVDDEPGHQTWSDSELAQFEAAYPIGTRERLVYSVLLFTGLRIGDAARLGRQHIRKGGHIELITEKKRVLVSLLILPELKAALAAGPHGREGELAFITSAHGRAFVKESLGNWFRDAVGRAGLSNRSAHGLRKAAARRFAEAGASEKQLNAIFGWTDPRMAAKYVRAADGKRIALQAMGNLKLEAIGDFVREETRGDLRGEIGNAIPAPWQKVRDGGEKP